MRLLTLARDLKRRKSREKQRLFVAEGIRAVEELLRSPLVIRGALIAPQLHEAPRGAALVESLRARGVTMEEVAAHEFGSAAETESPQGVIGIAEAPRNFLGELPADWKGILLVLDAVQDPGNVGTIVRTAAALGAVGTITLPGTVDLWNAKVVRSGMGAHFRHPTFSSTWAELDTFRVQAGVKLFVADVTGTPASASRRPDRLALVVGNEGSGVSAEAHARADETIALQLHPDVESLNVAVATGILLYLFGQ